MTIQRPKGTMDIFGNDALLWQSVEGTIREIAVLFDIGEIRTPMFEPEELFTRSVGESTDIVSKEMYTFSDAGGRRYALKAEGTAPSARAFIENSMANQPMPVKMYYLAHIFRAERPQKGRYRQHHQFGVEYFGSNAAAADAELISVAWHLFTKLGLDGITLHLNSIGDKECRGRYNQALTEFLKSCAAQLCSLCNERMEKNPMRVLDCKNARCQELLAEAPVPIDSVSPAALEHFEQLQNLLTSLEIPFVADKRLVRGLDYYTRTVFEFKAAGIGAQDTVCGGGRYDGLIELHGGRPTGAVGFGMGIERLLLLLEEQQKLPIINKEACVFVGHMGEGGLVKAVEIAHKLRLAGISAQCDLAGRSVKAQFKHADRLNAKFALIIGDSELAAGRAEVKNMQTGEGVEIEINNLADYLGRH